MPCTCGQCIGGLLSPRTARRIRACAAESAELLMDTLPDFPGEQPIHDPQAYLFDYVPPELRVEVAKPFVVGFGNCMRTVGYLLGQGQLPKPRLVAQCATIVPGVDKSASQAYLARGGMPEFALDAVLAQAQTGGGGLSGEAEAELGPAAGQADSLPACANDDQWELVRQRLFENSDFWPMGPYEDDDGAWEDDTVYYS